MARHGGGCGAGGVLHSSTSPLYAVLVSERFCVLSVTSYSHQLLLDASEIQPKVLTVS